MPLSDFQSSLFASSQRSLEERAALLARIGSQSPEALNLDEIRAICRYLAEQLAKAAQIDASA